MYASKKRCVVTLAGVTCLLPIFTMDKLPTPGSKASMDLEDTLIPHAQVCSSADCQDLYSY